MLRIGFIPLDDRPCTSIFPGRMARIVEAEVVQPPREALGTFLTPGDYSRLKEWLFLVAGKVDCLIVSLDMLAYGGLIASRLPTVSQDEAVRRINLLREVKRLFPQLPILAWNVIMRTSITVYDDLTARYWEEMNRYSVLWAKARQGLLTDEEQQALEELSQSIPQEVRDNYFAARRRNHGVNLAAIQMLKDGILSQLSLTQEDAHPFGPHRLEQEELKRHIPARDWEQRVFLYPGADEGGLTLMARAVQEHHKCPVSVRTAFYPEGAGLHIAKFEDVPLGENVRLQSGAAGLGDHSPKGPTLWAAVLGPTDSVSGIDVWQKPDHMGLSSIDYEKLWQDMRAAQERGSYPVILDVVQPNGSDPALFQALKGRGLNTLAAYAGWNTAGNTIGTGLAHGALYAVGEKSGTLDRTAHLEFLAERILDDYAYQRIVREELAELIQENPQFGNRHHLSSEGWNELNAVVQAKLQAWANANLPLYSLPPVEVKAFLPWPRIFEVNVSCRIDGR